MPNYTLTINLYDGGTTNPTSGGVYASGTVVTITAYPDVDHRFAYWTGHLTGTDNPKNITMNADKTVNAWFALEDTTELTLPVPSVVGSFDYITPTKEVVLPAPSVVSSSVTTDVEDIDGVILKDNSPLTYTDYTSQANDDVINDVVLMNATPATSDAVFFGVADIDYDMIRYVIDIGTAGVGTWTFVYYYYNGSTWVALPSANIIFKSDQFLNFKTAGLGSLWIIPPDDWATVAVNGVTLYWIEARVTAYSAKTTIPLGTRIYQSPITYQQTYYETLNDAIVVADVFSKQANIAKNDYLNISDSLVKNTNLVKNDYMYITDYLTKRSNFQFKDTIHFTEIFVSGGNVYFEFLSDNIYLLDRSQKTAYMRRYEYMGISDSRSAMAYLAKYDTVYVNDSLSRRVDQIKSDLVHIGDSISKVANVIYNNIVEFTDHIRNEIAFTFSTLFNISDRFTKAITTTKNDSIHITDLILKRAEINPNDIITFTDTIGDKHIDFVIDDKIAFEDIKTELTNMGMSDSITFADDHFQIKLKTTDMVTIHLAVRLP